MSKQKAMTEEQKIARTVFKQAIREATSYNIRRPETKEIVQRTACHKDFEDQPMQALVQVCESATVINLEGHSQDALDNRTYQREKRYMPNYTNKMIADACERIMGYCCLFIMRREQALEQRMYEQRNQPLYNGKDFTQQHMSNEDAERDNNFEKERGENDITSGQGMRKTMEQAIDSLEKIGILLNNFWLTKVDQKSQAFLDRNGTLPWIMERKESILEPKDKFFNTYEDYKRIMSKNRGNEVLTRSEQEIGEKANLKDYEI